MIVLPILYLGSTKRLSNLSKLTDCQAHGFLLLSDESTRKA